MASNFHLMQMQVIKNINVATKDSEFPEKHL